MRKLKKEIKQGLLLSGLVGIGLLTSQTPRLVSAYYTDTFLDKNTFQVKEVTGDIVEEFDPPTLPPDIPEYPYMIEYQKDVNVMNTSDTETYVRITMEISDPDVAEVTEYSFDDGKTWYSTSEYRFHLPKNWVYEESSELGDGGYFYYTKSLQPHSQADTSLLTRVRTTYTKDIDVIPYEIIVKVEWIDVFDQYGNHTEGKDAWRNSWEAHVKGNRNA